MSEIFYASLKNFILYDISHLYYVDYHGKNFTEDFFLSIVVAKFCFFLLWCWCALANP